MTRRMVFPLLLGLVGGAILIALGTWQVQRMHWKQDVIAGIEARIHDAPQALPASPQPDADRYRPVQLAGSFSDESLRVMASQRGAGAGFHIVSAFETAQGRRIMVDRGFVAEARLDEVGQGGAAEVTGHLHWPQDADLFTPDPDREAMLWFSRDVEGMAQALGTEPVLVVAAALDPSVPVPRPVPVGTQDIPDNHFEYALTWYGLALVWLCMAGYLLWRVRRRTV